MNGNGQFDQTALHRAPAALMRCLAALAVAADPSTMLDRMLPELAAGFDADGAFVLTPHGVPGGALTVSAASRACHLGMRLPDSGLIARLEAAKTLATALDVDRITGWCDPPAAPPAQAALLLVIGTTDQPALLVCPSGRRDHFMPADVENARLLASVIREALARAADHQRLQVEIAERLRAEAELKRQQAMMVHAHKMEAIVQLAAGMAHEINTPLQYASDNLRFLSGALAAISGAIPTLAAWLEPHMDKAVLRQFLDMSDVEYLSIEAPKAAEQCREGIDRVGTIVRSLKRFAETDSGSTEPADLNEAVRATVDICAGDLRDAADLHLDLGELPPVPCRVAEIRQVVHILILNAVQAIEERTGGGRGTVVISTRAIPEGVAIVVQDDGCGMDPEVARRACEPFFTTRVVGNGSGQGLTIAHEVMRRHGGSLRIESEPGKGTLVHLHLPLVPPAS